MKICVYCGSSRGNNEIYRQAAAELGKTFAQRQIGLIYGGGRVGLMGLIAESAMKHGGEVTGIIPHFLNDSEGIAFDSITHVHVTDTMHTRKAMMYDMADGFIALPGGYGTLDEVFETVTWAQLGLHQKPIGLLNINGYYSHLVAHLDLMVREGFLSEKNRSMLLIADTLPELLQLMWHYKAPDSSKWLDNVVL
ncbi:MAG: hypothetical protein RI894_754 [Bacteroidota bacterium]|jgi:uncharacterized protein (TIGR00730 family)